MTEEIKVQTDRMRKLVETIRECEQQRIDAIKRMVIAQKELSCLAPHKEGEIITYTKKGSLRRTGSFLRPTIVRSEDKRVKAVLKRVDVYGVHDGYMLYRYTFHSVKNDGSISQNKVNLSISETDGIEWTGEIHESYKEKETCENKD